MRECDQMTEREALPLLASGRLAASDAARVRAHVARCVACADELALLERSARLFDAATPRIDVSAIVAKLPPAPARPALQVVRGASRRPLVPRYALAAAASLTLVATLSFATLKDRVFGDATMPSPLPDSAMPVALGGSEPAGSAPSLLPMVGAAELDDLGASELEALLSELDQLEATVAAEPISMRRAVVDAPEVF